MKIDPVIDTLLDLDGSILDQENGYWIKIEAKRSVISDEVPHGIRYSLTLHEPYGKRILGYDNAHVVKPPKKFNMRVASWLSITSTGMFQTRACHMNSRMRNNC